MSAEFPYVTGLCAVGGHEGKPVFSAKGAMLKRCDGDYTFRGIGITCNCWCHEMFRALRAAQTPAVSDASDDTTPLPVLYRDRTASTPSVPALPVPVDVLADRRRQVYRKLADDPYLTNTLLAFLHKYELVTKDARQPTLYSGLLLSGMFAGYMDRRPRGSLDVNVECACLLWLDKKLPFPDLTIDIIALLIDPSDKPSAGAIHAVLTRWTEDGLCEMGRDPVRFLRFTDKVLLGVAEAKTKREREKKAHDKGFF